MVSLALSPKQRQGALAELERVIARLDRARANQIAAVSRLSAVRQPTTRMLGLLRTTEKYLAHLHEIRQALLAQELLLDSSEDAR